MLATSYEMDPMPVVSWTGSPDRASTWPDASSSMKAPVVLTSRDPYLRVVCVCVSEDDLVCIVWNNNGGKKHQLIVMLWFWVSMHTYKRTHARPGAHNCKRFRCIAKEAEI